MVKKSVPKINFWKNKKIFITGHTSFKGSWLKLWLETMGAKVTGYSIDYPSSPTSLSKILFKDKLKKENILNLKLLEKKINESKAEIAFHLAAQSIVSEAKQNPIKTYKTNILGTACFMEACLKSKNLKLAAVITTDKCYDDSLKNNFYSEKSTLGGSEPYSASKASSEIIAKSYSQVFKSKNKKIITLRSGNVLGGGDWKKNRLIPDIIFAFKKNTHLKIRNPKATRPWLHVLDCLNGYLLAAEKIFKTNIFFDTWNFAPKMTYQVKVFDLIDSFKKIFPFFIRKIKIQKKKNFYESLKLNLSSKKANDKLNWYPILQKKDLVLFTFEWYRAFFEKKNMKEFSKKQILQFLSLK